MFNLPTAQLYYDDNKLYEFTAEVIDCIEYKNQYGIILNQTAFYPEGGGQPGDTGFINEIPVINTIKCNGNIIHITDTPLEIKSKAEGKLDYKRRFYLMQQHTGEHMLSGILNQLFDCDNVGFHIGADYVSIDVNKKLDEQQLLEAESLVNTAIYKNLPVSILLPENEELKSLNYRSKIELEGQVRLVSIPECDVCACCGLHCSSTGEVGMVKILSSQSYKGGTRIFLICGNGALEDYRNKNNDIHKISALLSAKTNEVSDAVEHLKSENTQLKHTANLLKEQIYKLKAEQYQGEKQVILFEKNMTAGDLGKFCTILSDCCETALVLNQESDTLFKYALCNKTHDVRPLSKILNEKLNGKGGGKPELVQGSFQCKKDLIESVLNSVLSN